MKNDDLYGANYGGDDGGDDDDGDDDGDNDDDDYLIVLCHNSLQGLVSWIDEAHSLPDHYMACHLAQS